MDEEDNTITIHPSEINVSADDKSKEEEGEDEEDEQEDPNLGEIEKQTRIKVWPFSLQSM